MEDMKHPGEGRPFKKDITYTTPGKRVKDYGVEKSKLPRTAGLEKIASTPAPERPFTNG